MERATTPVLLAISCQQEHLPDEGANTEAEFD
jgi:hypothetical protein